MNQILVSILIGAGLAGGLPADPLREKPQGPEAQGKARGDYFATMLRSLDADEDRSISFEEFAAGERVKNLPEEAQRRLFDRLDKDADGAITRDEIPRGRGEHMGRPFDPDGDGRVTFEEFRQNPRLAKMPEERRRALFARMDRNGDGELGPKDWKGRRPGGGPGRPPGPGGSGMASLDTDGDGAVSFAEFQAGPRMKERPEEMQKKAFSKLDRDGNGSLEREEMKAGGPRHGGKRPEGKRPEGKRPGGGGRVRPDGPKQG